MNSEINLLPKKQKGSQRLQHIIRAYRMGSYVSLSVVAAVAVMFFLLQVFSPLTNAKKKEASLTQQLATMQAKITKIVVLRDRTQQIQTILKTRSQVSGKLGDILAAGVGSISFTTIQITAKDISINATATSLRDIDKMLNSVVGLVEKDKSFKKITLNSVSFNAEARKFAVSFTITLL